MILRIILVALRNLIRQPFRTFLILQGVVWGTALGVFPPAVINGSMKLVETEAGRLGTDRLVVTQDAEADREFDWEFVDRLRREHAATLRHLTGMTVTSDEVSAVQRFISVEANALPARGLRLARGRFFTEAEVRDAKPLCVLESGAARIAFDDADPIGRQLAWSGGALEVIGVTASRAADGEVLDEFGYHKQHPMRKLLEEMKQYVGVFDDPDLAELTGDNSAMIPHTLIADSRPHWIEARADPRDVLRLKNELQQELSAAGYEPQLYANAILPVLYGETIKTAIELNHAVFVLCIIVGTAVVCSIMILSVVERQREIAIRRVEGARRWHIALQFIVETGTLCAVGAVAGVPLGLVLAAIRCALEPLGSVTWTVPGTESCIIVGIVTAIGLVGGLLPAWRAMRVDPVEMLRYE